MKWSNVRDRGMMMTKAMLGVAAISMVAAVAVETALADPPFNCHCEVVDCNGITIHSYANCAAGEGCSCVPAYNTPPAGEEPCIRAIRAVCIVIP